jgi:hypothetical protein
LVYFVQTDKKVVSVFIAFSCHFSNYALADTLCNPAFTDESNELGSCP